MANLSIAGINLLQSPPLCDEGVHLIQQLSKRGKASPWGQKSNSRCSTFSFQEQKRLKEFEVITQAKYFCLLSCLNNKTSKLKTLPGYPTPAFDCSLAHACTKVIWKHHCILSWACWRLSSCLHFCNQHNLNEIPPAGLNFLAIWD